MTKTVLEITDGDIGERIDVFISSKIDEISRSHVQKMLKEELVIINNDSTLKNDAKTNVVAKSNYKLRCGDCITVQMKEPEILDVKPEKMELDIIFEDEHLIVVNKERGMVVHPSCGHSSGTLVNGLMHHTQNDNNKSNLSTINDVVRPGIVHRIDKDTSGILVIAKTDVAHIELSNQLKNHTMTRKYYGIVRGRVKEDDGTVNKPIGRHPMDRKKMSVFHESTTRKTRNAITHYRVIEYLKEATLVEFTLETGRTHQIRVHMLSINHPLVGDPVYFLGNPNKNKNQTGQILHAKTLGFNHPITGEYLEFESPLPEYFISKLNKLKVST